MKDAFYFTHDYNARNDPKLQRVVMKLGMCGIGCYWSIIEMLYEESGYLRIEYDRISFELRVEENVIRQLLNDFELFELNEERFWSKSVLNRLERRMSKSVKCKESINKRWEEYRRNTNVLQSEYESNTRKEEERRGKKRKGEERKKKEDATASVADRDQLHVEFVKLYCDWYLTKIGVKYKFQGGEDGNAIKSMKMYIKSSIQDKTGIEPSDEVVINGWRFILENYDKWDNFYKKQLKISQVNSNLPNIMANIKGINGTSRESASDIHARISEIVRGGRSEG